MLRKPLLNLCFISALCFGLFLSSATGKELIKPELDNREYRLITLDNKIRVTLISDKEAQEAAASINIKVGCYEDPEDIPGMAHFLEHMLFLGTQKYPEPNAFSDYLNTNGGFNNAFTGADSTNFFFTVNYNKLEGALERLSQFFIHPLFTESLIQQELNAINAEHSMNMEEDFHRFLQVQTSLFRPDHPASKFCTGNKETLKDVPNLKKRVQDFYEYHYSANLMRLAIIGRESLDVLQGYAETYFGNIKNTNKVRKKYDWDIMDPQYVPGILHIKPLREQRTLVLDFMLPPYIEHYTEKPWVVLSGLIGEESEGSLHHFLLTQNWITSLNTGFHTGEEGSYFSIRMDLTDEGIKKTDDITRYFFAYLNLVKREGLKDWRYEEHRKLAQTSFKFLEKKESLSTVIQMTMQPDVISAEDMLYGDYRFNGFNLKLLNDILSYIIPERMLLTIQAQEVKTDQKEKWYGTDFSFIKPNRATLQGWTQAFTGKMKNVAFQLTPQNKYIPNDKRIIPKKTKSEFPNLAYDQKGIKFWYFKDDRFKQSKSQMQIDFELPLVYASPRYSLMTKIMINIWKENLNPYLYSAGVAGYTIDLQFQESGMALSLNGYNEKLPLLLDDILNITKNVDIDQKRFEAIKNDLIRRWKNMDQEDAVNLASYDMTHLAIQKRWHKDEYLTIGKGIRFEDVRRFHQTFFSNMSIKAFLYGNTSLTLQNDILERLQKRFQFVPLFESQFFQNPYLNFDNGKDYVRSFEVEDKDSAVLLLFQGDAPDLKAQHVGRVLSKIIRGPFFEQLRTQEQLGYIVHSSFYDMNYVPGFMFLIQSPEKDPIYLKERIQSFLRSFETELKNLPDETLQSVKNAMINRLKEAPKTSHEAFEQFWSQIQRKDFNFEDRKIAIKLVASITQKDVMDLYHRLMLDNNNAELAIMSWGAEFEQKTPSGMLIENPIPFKRQQNFFGSYTFSDMLQ